MRHPAENFIKYLLIKDQGVTDAQVLKSLEDWGFLSPEAPYLGFLRQEVSQPPANFDPLNRMHRPSMNFLREHGVFELFYKTPATDEAWNILSEPFLRLNVEKALLARLDKKVVAQKLNKKHSWKLTEEGISTFHNFFWNVRLLTWEQWGRFLYGRSAMYEQYMSLLQASPSLAFFHLHLEQTLESKHMIKRTQEIAYHTLEEVSLKPGTDPAKIKAIGVLGKTVIECHEALSTSDMALKDALKEFERFRMEHPQTPAPDIKRLAPGGNYSGSGADQKTLPAPEGSH